MPAKTLNITTASVAVKFSGGREYYCKPCDNHGMYEQGEAPPRVQMLADGRFAELRTEMREEIAKRKAAKVCPECGIEKSLH
jgi:hypothetical protein